MRFVDIIGLIWVSYTFSVGIDTQTIIKEAEVTKNDRQQRHIDPND